MSFEKILKKINHIEHPIFRFAPSPNGKPTLGHLKGLCLIDYFRNLTQGKLILRFDDTNPKESYLLDNYDAMIQLATELDVKLDLIFKSSDNHSLYMKQVKRLISLKKAYICSCAPTINLLSPIKCNCFDLERKLDVLDKPDPKFSVKFRSENTEPFVIYRVIDSEWYPTIALQGPIDDHDQNISVIFRGRDLQSLESRQRQIHESLYEEPYPLCFYWGRISLWNPRTKKVWALSKSLLKDTNKFPSLNFFKRWGVTLSTLKEYVLSYGFTKNDIKLDLGKLSHFQIGHLKRKGTLNKPFIRWKPKDSKESYYGYLGDKYLLCYNTWTFKKLSP